jgi:nicotinamidase/pyrazinamidase
MDVMDETSRTAADAVIVIDMLVGFCKRGNLFSPRYEPLIPRLSAHLRQAEKEGSRLVFLADTHAPDDPEFRTFPPHCVEGSGEEEVVPELAEFVRRGVLVRKHTFSGFRGTDLDDVLQRLAPERVEVAGVCTDICVLHTVYDLRVRGYEVVVGRDLVETYDAPDHDAREINRFALGHIRDVLGAAVE